MVKKIFFLINVALFLFSLTTIFCQSIYASEVIFKDDFESYANGSFPTKWQEYTQSPKCSTPWRVENGRLGIAINEHNCNTHIIPNENEWPNSISEYEIELDLEFISGVDRHIAYRINPDTSFIHVIHFETPGGFTVDVDSPTTYTNINAVYELNTIYHFKIIVTSNRLKIYSGDANGNNMQLIKDILQSPIPNGTFGLGSNPGSKDEITETWFDNIIIRTIDQEPTTTTTTTTTIPSQVNLNIPSIKQTSAPWGSQIYDSAKNWARNNPTISSWGCALTSGTMILNYYGINKLPNGSNLNPGSLNIWLNHQKDGYISTGWVNWLALSRLSKLSKSTNNITSFDALEYFRKNTTDLNDLLNDINNYYADIVEVPGHFIVAKGINGNTININDPYYDRNTLSAYSNEFLSLGKFIPTHTDLSYIMVVTDPNTSIIIKDINGNKTEESYTQQPLVSKTNNNQKNYPINILYFPKPISGNYQMLISSSINKIANFKIYLYNQNGDNKIINESILVNQEPSSVKINFDKNDLSKSFILRKVTIDTLINDIKTLKNIKLIQPKSANLLKTLANSIKYDLKMKNKKLAIIKLKIIKNMIEISPKKIINKDAKNILSVNIISILQEIINNSNN